MIVNFTHMSIITNEKNHYGLTVDEFIEQALKEDTGDGDHTSLSTIPEELQGKANVKVKEKGIIAGLEVARLIFTKVDPSIDLEFYTTEGKEVEVGEVVISAQGSVRSLLQAERLVLNCMQRMSGIASLTKKYVDELRGTQTKVLDTRKTTPNFRYFEKQAIKIGGGENHRFGLYDMILIKDNHVDAAGGIKNAILRANEYLFNQSKKLKIEIETRNLKEVNEVLSLGKVDRIMLDNFSPVDLKAAITLIGNKFETEASGGITLETIRSFALTGVNYISVGALTHSYKSLDISMKIEN